MVNDTVVPPGISVLAAGDDITNSPNTNAQLRGPAGKPVKAVHVSVSDLNIHVGLDDEGFHLGVTILRL